MIPVDYFQPESFQQANPLLSGIQAGQGIYSNAQNIYSRGIQNQYLPQTLQQQLQQLQLRNAQLGIQNQYMPGQLQANIGLTQAQTGTQQAMPAYYRAQTGLIGTEAAKNQFLLNNPMMMLPGIAGQLGGYLWLQQHNPSLFNQVNGGSPIPQTQPTAAPTQNNVPPSTMSMAPQNSALFGPQNPAPAQIAGFPASQNAVIPNAANANNMPQNALAATPSIMPSAQNPNGMPNPNSLGNLLLQGITLPLQKDMAMTRYYQARGQGYNWSQLPADQKDSLIAQATGMGVDPNKALPYFMQGGTIQGMATQLGLDPNNLPDPIYPATKGSLTQIQRRQQALSEINTINPVLTSAIAPYATRFDGYSPSQIADSISNDNPDQQARYLAARALQPEMSALRVKAMGGQVGIQAIQEITNSSMGNLKAFGPLINPQVYKASQQYLDQWIQQAAQTANKSLYNRLPSQQGSPVQVGAGGVPNVGGANAGIADGVSKVINGQTYVKTNGQWYRQ